MLWSSCLIGVGGGAALQALGQTFLKSLLTTLLFVSQLWATTSRPAVSRGPQGAAICANSAGETAPSLTLSRTTTTAEPSSQY